MEEGWNLQEVSSDEFSWGLVAENRDGVRLNAAQPKGKSDQCIVRVGCNLVDAKSFLDRLNKKESEKLIWDLRFELARQKVEFDGLTLPLNLVSIQQTVYADGLTKNVFARMVTRVLRSAMLLQWTLERRLGHIPSSDAVH